MTEYTTDYVGQLCREEPASGKTAPGRSRDAIVCCALADRNGNTTYRLVDLYRATGEFAIRRHPHLRHRGRQRGVRGTRPPADAGRAARAANSRFARGPLQRVRRRFRRG